MQGVKRVVVGRLIFAGFINHLTGAFLAGYAGQEALVARSPVSDRGSIQLPYHPAHIVAIACDGAIISITHLYSGPASETRKRVFDRQGST
jgi:hypothetical protein